MIKQHIGQVEPIGLPEITKETIVARIDTGAQTSAIWACEVEEIEGKLHVVFFCDDKAKVKIQPVTFKEYGTVKVISSNGQSERRYKVKLLVCIADRKIRAWFTLADRSKQTYPVLIGRNVLKGKFVVDVSKELSE
jgi:hypothetical protein